MPRLVLLKKRSTVMGRPSFAHDLTGLENACACAVELLIIPIISSLSANPMQALLSLQKCTRTSLVCLFQELQGSGHHF